MKIQIKVKAGARCDCVSFDEEKNLYSVQIRIPPVEGRANEAVIKLLAGYFKVPKSEISLKTGQKAIIKIFEIKD